MTIEDYCRDHRNWSEEVFGPPTKHDAEKLLKHIGLELDEVRKAPHDLEEWVDIIILAIDGAWRSGHCSYEIERALIRKQEKNKARVWNINLNSTEPNLHVKGYTGEEFREGFRQQVLPLDERETNP